MSNFTHTRTADFKVGDRVEIHPAHDHFMRGMRYATVEAVGKKFVHVRYDRFRHAVYPISPVNLSKVEMH